MELHIKDERMTRAFGIRLGAALGGGEIIRLVGDVGAGKTTLTKAIAAGMGIKDDIGSPSYTLGQTYQAPHGQRLIHYDFYRLADPGLLAHELQEISQNGSDVIIIEWGDIVSEILPSDHLEIVIMPIGETERTLTMSSFGAVSRRLLEAIS